MFKEIPTTDVKREIRWYSRWTRRPSDTRLSTNQQASSIFRTRTAMKICWIEITPKRSIFPTAITLILTTSTNCGFCTINLRKNGLKGCASTIRGCVGAECYNIDLMNSMCNSNLIYQCVAKANLKPIRSSKSTSNPTLPSYLALQVDRFPVQPQRLATGSLWLRRVCLHLPTCQRPLQQNCLLQSVSLNLLRDEAALWKITWADPAFGDTIAIGTFKRKVAIFQLSKGTWSEIAFHELHEGSVNHVEWAPA